MFESQLTHISNPRQQLECTDPESPIQPSYSFIERYLAKGVKGARINAIMLLNLPEGGQTEYIIK